MGLTCKAQNALEIQDLIKKQREKKQTNNIKKKEVIFEMMKSNPHIKDIQVGRHNIQVLISVYFILFHFYMHVL